MQPFTGLRGRVSDVEDGTYYRGAPCLHVKHCGEDGTSKAWRDSHTHACLECLEDIGNGYIALDVKKLHPAYQRIALKFWSKVEIETWDECWRWTGEPDKDRKLRYFWKRPELQHNYSFHPIAVMLWLTRGDIARKATETTCGERRCCNPLHHMPKGYTDINREHLDEQRSLLLSQIHKFETVRFDPDLKIEPDEGFTQVYDAAYKRALNNLCQTLIK